MILSSSSPSTHSTGWSCGVQIWTWGATICDVIISNLYPPFAHAWVVILDSVFVVALYSNISSPWVVGRLPLVAYISHCGAISSPVLNRGRKDRHPHFSGGAALSGLLAGRFHLRYCLAEALLAKVVAVLFD